MVIIMKRVSNDAKVVKTKEKVKKKFSMKRKKLTQKDIKKYSNTQLDHVIERIKEQESKFTVILVTIILISSLIAFYSIFSSVQDSKYEYVIKSNNLTIMYKKKDNNMGNIISFVDKEALGNSDGLKSDDYKIFISNTSDRSVVYTISVVDDDDMIKYDGCSNKIISRNYIKYSINDSEVLSLGSDDVIYSSILKANSKIEYSLRFWIDEDFAEAINSHYHGKIVVSELSPDKK